MLNDSVVFVLMFTFQLGLIGGWKRRKEGYGDVGFYIFDSFTSSFQKLGEM